jgi:hypothetical protein
VCQLYISPRREAFTQPLPKGKFLKLIFTGTCAETHWKETSRWCGFDACYSADTYDHSYKHRHYKLLLDGKIPAKGPIEEDRHDHRYSFVYETTGNRLSVMLQTVSQNSTISGVLNLCIVPFTPLEEYSLALQDIFSPERLRAEAERKQQEARSKQALELAVKARIDKDFLDPIFQQRYAKRHVARILHTESREWSEEYYMILSDSGLRALIEEQHPQILEVFEGKFTVVSIAKNLAVAPAPKPPAPEPPPPEKTSEEKRAEDLSSFKDTTAHYRQKALLRLAIEQEFLDELHKQFPNLSPQELQQELQKFRDEELSGSNGRRPSRPIKTY